MNDNNEIKKENNKNDENKSCCKIWCITYLVFIGLLIATLIITCCMVIDYTFEINKIILTNSIDKTINIIWLICIAVIFITIIVCLTIVLCKAIKPNKEKCNSYDEALTKMLNK